MKSFISIIILSIMLTNCGFKPIYSSKDSNFEIIEIINENENKNSYAIENPNLIDSIASNFGSQAITISLQVKRIDNTFE